MPPRKGPPKDSYDLSSFLPSRAKGGDTRPTAASTSQRATSASKDGAINSATPALNADNGRYAEFAESDAAAGPAPPISHRAVLSDHNKMVTALSLDPSGSRLLSGGADYAVKFWDFNGMDRTLKPFRTIMPWEGYQINDLQYSLKGEMFLVATGSAQMKLYDRDGLEVMAYNKGDPYIRDMRNTRGHIAGVTCCQWHPSDRDLFMTASEDSTLRIWSLENKTQPKHVIVAKKGGAGHRLSASVTSACFSVDGKHVAGAVKDGSIALWEWSKPFLKPAFYIPNAHTPDTDTSRIAMAPDGFTLATRGGDDTMKMWDLRMFSRPTKVYAQLENNFATSDVTFSPDGRFVCAGTSLKKGTGMGKLLIFSCDNFEKVHDIAVSPSSVVRILWHPKLNQIMTGNGDGSITVFYDPATSHNGAMLSMVKMQKKRKMDTIMDVDDSFTPNAIIHNDVDAKHPNRWTNRRDPVMTRFPQMGYAFGAERDKANMAASAQVTILSDDSRDKTRDVDPREALLKYAKDAEENPKWIAQAYAKTQPKAIFDDYQDELEKKREVVRRQ